MKISTAIASATAGRVFTCRAKFWKNVGLPPRRSRNCTAGDVLVLRLPSGWHLPFGCDGLALRTPAR